MRFGIAFTPCRPESNRGKRLTEDCTRSLLCTNMSK